jgi:dimethylargininase
VVALVRRASPAAGLSERACAQHATFIEALRHARVTIVQVPEMPEQPDALFIEDTAFVLDELAILARPFAVERRAEIPLVAAALSHYRHLVTVPPDACFAASDLLSVGRHVYIGETAHTNAEAIAFLKTLLRQYQRQVTVVPVGGGALLKTAVSYLGGNTVLLNPDWVPREAFAAYKQIEVDPEEPLAANALLARSYLFLAARYPSTARRVRAPGFVPDLLDLSEFQRGGAGPSRLAIVFTVNGPA